MKPSTVENVKMVVDLLKTSDILHITNTPSGSATKDTVFALIMALLDDLRKGNEDQDNAEALSFLWQQVDVLLRKKPKYTTYYIMFATHTLSPHSYKFISTSRIMLPHPSTIRRLCSNKSKTMNNCLPT